jgi:hypothetical protein
MNIPQRKASDNEAAFELQTRHDEDLDDGKFAADITPAIAI